MKEQWIAECGSLPVGNIKGSEWASSSKEVQVGDQRGCCTVGGGALFILLLLSPLRLETLRMLFVCHDPDICSLVYSPCDVRCSTVFYVFSLLLPASVFTINRALFAIICFMLHRVPCPRLKEKRTKTAN